MIALRGRPQALRGESGEDPNFSRLNRRFGILLYALVIVYPMIFIIVCLSQAVSLAFCGIHLAMYAMALAFLLLTRMRDATTAFIVTHPFWNYSFSLFAYALGYWKSPETDLYAAKLSSMVALVALAASICGWLVAMGACQAFKLARSGPNPAPWRRRNPGVGVVLLAAPMILLPALLGQSPFLASVSGMFEPLLWLGVLAYSADRGMRAFRSPIMLLVLLITFALSIIFNARGILFAFGITLVIVYFGVSKRPLSAMRLILFYLVANAASAFSYVMLGARQIAARAEAGAVALQTIFTPDFLLAVLGFDTLSQKLAGLDNQLQRHDRYILNMFDGRLAIAERLTQLPHMDIVVARLPYPMSVRWGEINNAIISSLPSVGQSKDIIFNDRLVWEEGLTPYGIAGHPLVTAAGEFYAMGGFIVLFLFFSVMMAATILFYQLSKWVFADRYVAAGALVCVTLYMVATSTSISALSVPMRIYPVALALYPLTRWLWTLFTPRVRQVQEHVTL